MNIPSILYIEHRLCLQVILQVLDMYHLNKIQNRPKIDFKRSVIDLQMTHFRTKIWKTGKLMEAIHGKIIKM